MSIRKWSTLIAILAVVSMILPACTSPAPATPVVQTVVVNQTSAPVVQTQVVTQEKVVTPTPEPLTAKASKDPSTFVIAEFGDPETFDPALDYETAGGEVLQQVYEGLVFYNKDKPTDFIPQLASEMPKISADGKTYTFTIRKGVKFHDGADLTPSDIAYSFQRGLLQGSTVSPQWLLAEPLIGQGKVDVADLVDSAMEDTPDKLKAADPAKLKAACETVTKAIVADDAAGTVTFNLVQPWGPFLATLAQPWGSAMEKKWVVANKGWDGSCDTWQNYYGITSENDPLTSIANGTGPFKLDHWTKGQEVVLARNDAYWRTTPAWDGGPTGPAKLKSVVIKNVNEWGTRFSMLQAGDADSAIVPRANIDQVDPIVGETCTYNAKATGGYDCKTTSNNPLRLYKGYPQTTRTDVFFTFKINVPEGGNPLVGSGKLDGNGVPADFFSDIHVRKAFNYCFDWDTYNKEVLKGEGVQATTIFMPGMPGYDANAPHYTFDLDKCKAEFQASTLKSADGKSLWDTGFRLQLAYNTGNTERQTIAEILATDISQVNDKFVVETIGMPWPAFLQAQRAKTLPLFASGWLEDIHDPHNWITPYATSTGTYSGRQNLPKELTDPWTQLAQQAVSETDFAKRDAIYKQFNQSYYDAATIIMGSLATGRHYEQRWVEGWFYNPIFSLNYYYPISKK